MAILLDCHQVIIASLQKQVSATKIKVLDEDLCRHLILNAIREVVFKFKRDYGRVIICCDSKSYWRKEVFPFYKASRKKLKEQSYLDFDLIYKILDEVKADMRDLFPYLVLEINRAEADDIIGVLAPRLAAHEPVIIVSADGDFKQLHQYKNIKQYNPGLRIFVTSPNPILELKEKIITGDRGDSIPSCISPDNVFVLGIRQKSLTAKLKSSLMDLDFDNLPDNDTSRYIARNTKLIDLSQIPKDIKNIIVEESEKEQSGSNNTMMKYFIKKKLGNLLECIGDF
jgi:hypothetical protein